LIIVGRNVPKPKIATEEKKKAIDARYIKVSVIAIFAHFLSNFSTPRKAALRFFRRAISSFSSWLRNQAVSGEVGKLSQQIKPKANENEPSMMKSHRQAVYF